MPGESSPASISTGRAASHASQTATLPGLENVHLAQVHGGAVRTQGREESKLVAPSRRLPDKTGGIERWVLGFRRRNLGRDERAEGKSYWAGRS
jgi:hypothetical protein